MTTLFLLHWYVFQRANQLERINSLGENFSYATRDTTNNFCRELCKHIIFGDDEARIKKLKEEKPENKKLYRLSTVIMDKIWYTSSYANDPSVKSMLTMLDTIEEKFACSGNYNTVDDFVTISSILSQPLCPITFSYLDVNDFDDEDMYIKMNARGKELTNFEIFKARLEEGNILEGVCYDADDEQPEKSRKLAEFMGKYNNEFTNLFYEIKEIGKKNYDFAFFQFVECIIKYDHYAQLIGYTDVSEGDYHTDFSNTMYTGASLFSEYILNPTLHDFRVDKTADKSAEYVDTLKRRTKDSLRKMTGILDFFVKYEFSEMPYYKNDLCSNNTTYDERKLFIKNAEGKRNNIDLTTQYALFSYLYLFDCVENFENKKNAYKEWKRFVCNITYGVTLKDPVNFAKMVAIFDAMLLALKQKCEEEGKEPDTVAILEIIAHYNDIRTIQKIPMEVIRHLFENEAYKANLMLDSCNGSEWSSCIRRAEDYYEDGDIRFIFEAIGDDLTPAKFEKAFEKARIWIDSRKHPQNTVAFNEALLCMEYPDKYKETAHLRIYTYDKSWQIYCGNQVNLREALSCKLNGKEDAAHLGIVSLIRNYDLNLSVEDYAEKLICEYREIPDCWLRNVLVNERLVKELIIHQTRWNFSGTIGRLNPSNCDEYILFYSTAYNSLNLELNIYRLAVKMLNNHHNINIVMISGKTRSRSTRYVELNGKKVGYDVEYKEFFNIDSQTYFTPVNGDYGMEEALSYLES